MRINETQNLILPNIDFPVTTGIALCVSVIDYKISALHVDKSRDIFDSDYMRKIDIKR